MKKSSNPKRILSRRLAQEMSRDEMEKATGAASRYATMTLTYPADDDPSGPIWV